jgi:hypothetical protein
MHFPGLRPFVDSAYPRTTAFGQIDSYRDNWWCSDMGGFSEQPNFYKEGAYSDALENFERTQPNYPAFLNTEQKVRAAAEWKQLLSVGLAKDYFARVSLDWANRHPDDPRAPEALHYAWRSQRWGCDNGARTKFPRELFRVLHDRYPKSDWTRKTTVWW